VGLGHVQQRQQAHFSEAVTAETKLEDVAGRVIRHLPKGVSIYTLAPLSRSRALGQELITAPKRAVEAASEALESINAAERLALAIDGFGDRLVVGTAFGAGGLCVLDLAQQHRQDVPAYTIDTGFNFDETVEVAARWEQDRKLNLRRLLPVLTVDEQAAEHGDALWARDPDQCCALRKVEPNQRALADVDLWVTALRRDESPSRATQPILQRVRLASGRAVLKLAPIADWSRKDVWRHIFERELPYNPLHDHGYPSIGCTHCTNAVADGEDERAGRWSGREKNECGLHLEAAD